MTDPDLVTRLRFEADLLDRLGASQPRTLALLREAADEIEKLRKMAVSEDDLDMLRLFHGWQESTSDDLR